MLIENDNHFHTLYLVVRLSVLDLKTWILSFSFETITENENDNHFHFCEICENPRFFVKCG